MLTFSSVPIGLVAITSLMVSWPTEDSFALFTWAKAASIDFLGGISIFLATTLLVYGIQQGGSENYIWGKQEIPVAFALAALSWVVFFTWQIALGFGRFPRIEPVFPVRLTFRRVYMGAFLYGHISLCAVRVR